MCRPRVAFSPLNFLVQGVEQTHSSTRQVRSSALMSRILLIRRPRSTTKEPRTRGAAPPSPLLAISETFVHEEGVRTVSSRPARVQRDEMLICPPQNQLNLRYASWIDASRRNRLFAVHIHECIVGVRICAVATRIPTFHIPVWRSVVAQTTRK